MMQVNGVITALFTPMFVDGRINWRSLEALIDFNVAHQAGVLSAGTTSESPTIHEEQGDIDKLVISKAKGTVPVVVGAGTYDTERSIELTRRAIGNGADATLHVMGYYNKPSQRGVMDYFAKVSEVDSNIPVIMYHIPGRGAAEYKPETIAVLAQRYKNINALKEASGETAVNVASRVRSLLDNGNTEFSIMSGDDDKTFELMTNPSIRANGVISVMSNLCPHMYVHLVKLCKEGNLEAQSINDILGPISGIVGIKVRDFIGVNGQAYEFTDTYRNPQPVKTAAYILGMTPELGFRSPMTRIPEEGVKAIGNALWRVHQASGEGAFRPVQEFFKPSPSINDRLMRYNS